MRELGLSERVTTILQASTVTRTAPRADTETVRARLREAGLTPHEPVLAFEASFGGLELFESRADPAALVVGPYAMVELRAPSPRIHELVPVMIACDDVVYSMDRDGRGYAMAAMVEGQPRPAAVDGRQLLSQAILWRRLAQGGGGLHTIEGLHGQAHAAELGLTAIAEASSEHERWWGDADRLVVELPRGNGWPGPMTWVSI